MYCHFFCKIVNLVYVERVSLLKPPQAICLTLATILKESVKRQLTLILLFVPFWVLGQQETQYYDTGQTKSEWKTDEASGTKTNYFYFETGELKLVGIYDSIGVLQNYFQFNQQGDTLRKSHIPEFKRQSKKVLTNIQWKHTASGIGFYYETKGKGKKIKSGDSVKVWYIGYFEDGSQFDNSDITGQILEIKIGEGKLLKSFEEGLSLFKKGQRGFIKIPPELGYGDKPAGNIPPNSTLIYEIEIK